MDVNNIRDDFPSLSGGKIYFDSACMSLKPKHVLNAMNEYYEKWPACGGRSSHEWGDTVTKKYEESREVVAKFIGASCKEVVFTKNATEGINLLSRSLGLKKGDVVLTTDREHNSNLIPWLLLKEKGIQHKIIPSNEDETFNLERFSELCKGARVVSVVHTSNLDGYTLPIREIIKIAHENESIVILDCAQGVPHHYINVKSLDADFIVFSGHKMLGPSIGVLYGKKELLKRLSPFLVGGDTVSDSNYNSYELMPVPERFEAGLQNYAGALGLKAACEYLLNIGMREVEQHEKKLGRILAEGLEKIEGIKILGVRGSGTISFVVRGMKHSDVGLMLNEFGVMVRTGQHCLHSWFNSRGIPGSVRASLYIYNNEDEVEKFLEILKNIVKMR